MLETRVYTQKEQLHIQLGYCHVQIPLSQGQALRDQLQYQLLHALEDTETSSPEAQQHLQRCGYFLQVACQFDEEGFRTLLQEIDSAFLAKLVRYARREYPRFVERLQETMSERAYAQLEEQVLNLTPVSLKDLVRLFKQLQHILTLIAEGRVIPQWPHPDFNAQKAQEQVQNLLPYFKSVADLPPAESQRFLQSLENEHLTQVLVLARQFNQSNLMDKLSQFLGQEAYDQYYLLAQQSVDLPLWEQARVLDALVTPTLPKNQQAASQAQTKPPLDPKLAQKAKAFLDQLATLNPSLIQSLLKQVSRQEMAHLYQASQQVESQKFQQILARILPEKLRQTLASQSAPDGRQLAQLLQNLNLKIKALRQAANNQ